MVRGFVAEVTVIQDFENILQSAIEAEYVFPLPADAAVNATEMIIGDRVIRGRVDRRDAARESYETARNEGKRASLLEQERPNIFTQSVANIRPGERIRVLIRYVETLPYREGRYELVFPMVVGPRYIPGMPLDGPEAAFAAGNGRALDTDEVPDASCITPRVLPSLGHPGFEIDLTVDIDMGVPIQAIHSRSHEVETAQRGESRAFVRLADDDRLPNKDFVLEIETAGDQAEVGILAHHDGEQGFFTLLLQPPHSPEPSEIRPTEFLCVLDCSGSMNGRPLALAKQATEALLRELGPTDRFNVLYFSTTAAAFRPESVPASPENVAAGADFVRAMAAHGGTEMITAVRAALTTPPPEEYLRVVAFFTDGYIGNETAILQAEEQMLGPARFFAFGVGSSVNRYLLDRMAIVGRGAVEYVLLDDDPSEAVARFVARVTDPVLTDVVLEFDGLVVCDLIPAYVPDVFADLPVFVHGRYASPGTARLKITGLIGIQPSATELELTLPEPDGEHSPLPSIWARQRIKELELDKLRANDPGALEERITELALEYSLMSAYTSFVAVDETPSTVAGPPQFIAVSVPMPDGVELESAINEIAAAKPCGAGGSGGGPVGPVGLAGIAAMVAIEWTRRRRAAPCSG